MMNKLILLVLTLLFFSSVSGRDILTLTNNQRFEGEIRKIKSCVLTFEVKRQVYLIPGEYIYSIEFEDSSCKVLTDYLSIGNGKNCFKGYQDAKGLHGKTGGAFALGVLFGPLAIIGTALCSPTPDRGRSTITLSQNQDLFGDPQYLECYKKTARRNLVASAALGWFVSIVLFIVITAN